MEIIMANTCWVLLLCWALTCFLSESSTFQYSEADSITASISNVGTLRDEEVIVSVQGPCLQWF